jgi:hypothetical protein
MNTELIAPCGMNCGLCASHLAFRHRIKAKGIRMAQCPGCRPRNKLCAFIKKKCPKLMKNKVRFCFECGDIPCERLQHLDQRYRTLFRMSMVENLKFIKKNGLAKFLTAQRKKWKCPKCGDTVCCHNGLCFSCDLAKLKKRKRIYRWKDD